MNKLIKVWKPIVEKLLPNSKTRNENWSKLIWLADHTPKEKKWLLEGAIAEGFPNLIYADGGIGKSYLGLYWAILTALGGQSFLGLKFPAHPINSLFVD